jgi:general secretion pathway protein F
MLLGVGGAVILFLLLYVLPRFAGILEQTSADLPWASRVLIEFGQTAGAHPPGARRPGGRGFAVFVLLRQPAVRQRRRRRCGRCRPGPAAARAGAGAAVPVARHAAGLGRAGAGGAEDRGRCGGRALARGGAGGGEQIERGERLSTAFDAQDLATPVARACCAWASAAARSRHAERAAAFHDEEAARLTDLLSRLVNPALMLIMGVLIGGIIVLMYLPIFQLVEQVQ